MSIQMTDDLRLYESNDSSLKESFKESFKESKESPAKPLESPKPDLSKEDLNDVIHYAELDLDQLHSQDQVEKLMEQYKQNLIDKKKHTLKALEEQLTKLHLLKI